ncbi:MAG: porin family protein [Gammaproteobacteria bacterium]|nr:porin family protein [Gammaproteobacteria bacterium]MBU1724760.1 porin family protein [Gammaproteobacteria bacterium]MBU2005767.1 porin family protein [Gammaproteobacteria bacterium]
MKKSLLLTALAVFSMSSAMANDRLDSNDDSGGGALYGGLSFGKTKADCGSIDCDDQNWKLYGGYEITSSIAAEAAYHRILNTQDIKVTGMSASGLYNVPVADNLKAFGKVGAIAWRSSDPSGSVDYNDGTDFLLGAGATYKIGDNWGIRGEYENIGGDVDADMYSVGAVFSTM